MKKVFISAVMLAAHMALGQILPVITTPPTNTTVSPGSTATFTVAATGATTYQWLFNGTDIPGATSATLQVANAQSTNSGYYSVITKNVTGWVPSQMAYLFLDYGTSGGILPLSNTNNLYAQGNIQSIDGFLAAPTNGTVQIVAGPELDQMQPVGVLARYRAKNEVIPWFFDGYFNAASQSVSTINPGQVVYYSVIAKYTNSEIYFHAITQPSTMMKLVAGTNGLPAPSAYGLRFPTWLAAEGIEPIVELLQPPNQLRVLGESFGFTNDYFAYTDYGDPATQWRKNGVPIPNATNNSGITGPSGGTARATLTFTNLQASDAGIYDLIVYGTEWVVGPKITLSVQTTNGQGVFQNPKLLGTNFISSLLGAAGRNYQVQWSTNLTAWTDLATLSNLTGTVTFTNPGPTGAQFYRTRLLP